MRHLGSYFLAIVQSYKQTRRCNSSRDWLSTHIHTSWNLNVAERSGQVQAFPAQLRQVVEASANGRLLPGGGIETPPTIERL